MQKIEIEMFTNLDVLHLPESEKLGFVMLYVGRSIYFSLSLSLSLSVLCGLLCARVRVRLYVCVWMYCIGIYTVHVYYYSMLRILDINDISVKIAYVIPMFMLC